MLLRPWILALGFMLSLPVYAQDLEVGSPWIRSAPPGVPLGGYMMLHNPSSDNLELVGADAEGFANTMIHTTRMVDGLMKMEHVHSVEIPAGGNTVFEPGGLHLMLMKPENAPQPGERVTVTLKFANGSTQVVTFHVKHPDEAMEMDHSGHGADANHEDNHESMDHGGKHMVHGDKVPTVSIHVHEQDSAKWVMMIETTNFTFSEANQDGDHVDGEGHGHLYVDGKKIQRVFDQHILLPPMHQGEHEIRLGLFTNNHNAYWTHHGPIEALVTVTVE